MAVRVFLVEDLAHLREVVSDLLATLGEFEVAGSARTEAEAILWLTDHPGGWDLAVLDLVLDQGTGMGVIAHAKRSPSPGKVIVFSDYASPGIEQHCLRLGADAVIAKGDIAALIAYCREMISI